MGFSSLVAHASPPAFTPHDRAMSRRAPPASNALWAPASARGWDASNRTRASPARALRLWAETRSRFEGKY